MGLPFTNLFASCCTSPSFVFGTRFATPPAPGSYPSYGPWHHARAARVPLSQGAKTRVRVFADIQNFALLAHCVHGIPLLVGGGGQRLGGPCFFVLQAGALDKGGLATTGGGGGGW